MTVTIPDLALLSQRMLSAIVRIERLGEIAARRTNNRKQRNRLRCYIYDNCIPDPTGDTDRLLYNGLPSCLRKYVSSEAKGVKVRAKLSSKEACRYVAVSSSKPGEKKPPAHLYRKSSIQVFSGVRVPMVLRTKVLPRPKIWISVVHTGRSIPKLLNAEIHWKGSLYRCVFNTVTGKWSESAGVHFTLLGEAKRQVILYIARATKQPATAPSSDDRVYTGRFGHRRTLLVWFNRYRPAGLKSVWLMSPPIKKCQRGTSHS